MALPKPGFFCGVNARRGLTTPVRGYIGDQIMKQTSSPKRFFGQSVGNTRPEAALTGSPEGRRYGAGILRFGGRRLPRRWPYHAKMTSRHAELSPIHASL